jgi:hypothetical protein
LSASANYCLLPQTVVPPDTWTVTRLKTLDGTILFPHSKLDPKREYSARVCVFPIEDELNVQLAGCAEKRVGIRPEWFSKSPLKSKYRAAEKEMNVKHRMDLRSFVRISGMSLGISVVHQFALKLAHLADVEIADDFTRKRDGGGNDRRSTLFPVENELTLRNSASPSSATRFSPGARWLHQSAFPTHCSMRLPSRRRLAFS